MDIHDDKLKPTETERHRFNQLTQFDGFDSQEEEDTSMPQAEYTIFVSDKWWLCQVTWLQSHKFLQWFAQNICQIIHLVLTNQGS